MPPSSRCTSKSRLGCCFWAPSPESLPIRVGTRSSGVSLIDMTLLGLPVGLRPPQPDAVGFMADRVEAAGVGLGYAFDDALAEAFSSRPAATGL